MNHEALDAPREPDGWELVQLWQLLSEAERRAHDAAFRLRGFDPEDLEIRNRARLDAEALTKVVDDVCALRDLAEQAGMLGGSFVPKHDRLDRSLSEIARQAAEAMTTGIHDPAAVMLAARLLSIKDGWRALAAVLSDGGVHSSWGLLTVSELLDAFTDATPKLVRRALAGAQIQSSRRFDALRHPEAERLAAALERHLPPRDPRIAWALDHPLRARIVLTISERDTTTASEVAKTLRLPTPRVNYHLRRLAQLGVVEVEAIMQERGPLKHVYRLARGANAAELLEYARRSLEADAAELMDYAHRSREADARKRD